MAEPLRILALGDSLTAGYGVAPDQAFPVRLEAALTARGYDVRLINAGVSGDTTAGGRARLAWALADKPHLAIVELGANDSLRGLDPDQARANLAAILAELRKRGVGTLLAGMLAPPNLGADYGARFNAIYPGLAQEFGVPLYPFFLEGVAGKALLNQPDGLHPNAQGIEVIVQSILPHLLPLLPKARP